jgi:hypothetical protein
MNHTTQMHQIARELPECDAWFTPYYCDPPLDWLRRAGALEFVALGERHRRRCLGYLQDNALQIDLEGARHAGRYDLVLTASDLIVPKNVERTPIVLVQEGMTDPEDWRYSLCRTVKIMPRWAAGSALTGLSLQYDRFCVASAGYRNLFIGKGVPADRIVVTGIPNFDNLRRLLGNKFPHKNHVQVCTSDLRETLRYDDRAGFLRGVAALAGTREVIFKLHPNENEARATREINRYVPGARVFAEGSAEEMIANANILVTQLSSVVYVGLALGLEVHSYFDLEELKRLLPLQNARAAANIAEVCRDVMTRHRLRRRANRSHPGDARYRSEGLQPRGLPQ